MVELRRVKDTRPLDVGDKIQCRICHEGIANGKTAGIQSGCNNVWIASLKHEGKVIAAVAGSDFVTVRYFDSKEPVKILRRELVRIAS